VHLATGSRRLAGDTTEMIAARAAFLATGHYAPITRALAGHAAVDAPGVIVDVGAGTGQHLAAVLDSHHPRMAAVTCDAWDALPVADGAAAVVLSVFAPRGAAEIRRVLAPTGVVLAVTPTERHLAELRDPLGLLRTAPGKADRLAEDLGLRERGRTPIEAELHLTAEEALLVARMGPAGHHDRAVASLPGTVTATLSVELTVLSSGA
jgi:23S rRNA (guanine745-N1)-methyltransferase